MVYKNPIEDMLKWKVLLTTAVLLWSVNSFDKFLVAEKLPMKGLYFSSVVLLGLSVLCFSTCWLMIFGKQTTDNQIDELTNEHQKETDKKEALWYSNELKKLQSIKAATENASVLMPKLLVLGIASFFSAIGLISIYFSIFIWRFS